MYATIIMSDADADADTGDDRGRGIRFGPGSAVPFQQAVAQLRPRWGLKFFGLRIIHNKDFRVTIPLLE